MVNVTIAIKDGFLSTGEILSDVINRHVLPVYFGPNGSRASITIPR